jgi:hypothetical protein
VLLVLFCDERPWVVRGYNRRKTFENFTCKILHSDAFSCNDGAYKKFSVNQYIEHCIPGIICAAVSQKIIEEIAENQNNTYS